MAKLLHCLEGSCGRSIRIFDRKCIISTKADMGSLLTANVTASEKTIFYTDVIGVQFKKSDNLIGYLQFETTAVQMNNQNSNMLCDNMFTFENGKNEITNELMENIYNQVCDLIEEIKYGPAPCCNNEPAAVVIPEVVPAPVPEVVPEPVPEPTPAPAPAPAPIPAPAPEKHFCGKCGSKTIPGATFCSICGNKLG